MREAIAHANGNLLRGLAIVAAIVAVLWIAPQTGEIEGRLLPVVTDFRLVTETAAPDGQIEATVEFSKVRHCQFINNVWHWMRSGRWIEAPLEYPEDNGHEPDSKPVGTYRATWLIGVPWAERAAPMRVISHHYCHGSALWITDTISDVHRE